MFHGAGTQGLPPGSLGSGFAWGNQMRGNSAGESKRVCPDGGAQPWLGREKNSRPPPQHKSQDPLHFSAGHRVAIYLLNFGFP